MTSVGRAARAMQARSSVDLPLAVEEVWRLTKRTPTQLYLSKQGFAYAADLPVERHEGYEASYRLRLFGRIPAWEHRQRFEVVDDERRELIVRESGGPYRVWDHTMRVEETVAGTSRFTDVIDVEAGLMTPVVWAAAWALCRSRARRWRELAPVLA